MYDINEHGELRPSSKRLISRLIMVEVVILFVSLLVAMALLGGGVPGKMPSLARTAFLGSTLLIVLSSVVFIWARKHPFEPYFWKLILANWVISILFLLGQALGFYAIFEALHNQEAAGHNVQMLYVITGVHAVHIAGGMVMLTRLVVGVLRETYSPKIDERLRLLEPYWHLLAVIWCVFYFIL